MSLSPRGKDESIEIVCLIDVSERYWESVPRKVIRGSVVSSAIEEGSIACALGVAEADGSSLSRRAINFLQGSRNPKKLPVSS